MLVVFYSSLFVLQIDFLNASKAKEELEKEVNILKQEISKLNQRLKPTVPGSINQTELGLLNEKNRKKERKKDKEITEMIFFFLFVLFQQSFLNYLNLISFLKMIHPSFISLRKLKNKTKKCVADVLSSLHSDAGDFRKV